MDENNEAPVGDGMRQGDVGLHETDVAPSRTDVPYPDTTCPTCQHYNRAVAEGGPLDLLREAEFAQLLLHTQAEMNGMDGRGTIAFAAGSSLHYTLMRLIEAARQAS